MPLIVYGLSRDRHQGKLHRADRGLADRRRASLLTPPSAGTRCAPSGRCSTSASTPTAIFAAASLTTFGLGAALFGAMILVPLYYQQVRGESVDRDRPPGRPAGARDALSRRRSPAPDRALRRRPRRHRRRLDPRPSARCPFAFIGADTSIVFISLVLLVRGVGIGLSFIPTTTVAFASLRTDQLSDATPQMNVLQRVGGAIGTAVLAVVLQRASAGAARPDRARRRLRHRLLVGARDLRRVAHPRASCCCAPRAARRAASAEPRRREIARRSSWSRSVPEGGGQAGGPVRRPTGARGGRITELGHAFRRAYRSLRRLRGRDTHRGDEIGHAQFELLVELLRARPAARGRAGRGGRGRAPPPSPACSTTSPPPSWSSAPARRPTAASSWSS